MQELTIFCIYNGWSGFTTPNINREVYTTHAQAEKKFRLSAIKPMKYLNNTGYISLPYFDVPESIHCINQMICRQYDENAHNEPTNPFVAHKTNQNRKKR